MPEHYCINTRHLLGEYATKQRHLQSLGYDIVGVSVEYLHLRLFVVASAYIDVN